VRRRIGELGWDIVHARLQEDAPKTLEETGLRWLEAAGRLEQLGGVAAAGRLVNQLRDTARVAAAVHAWREDRDIAPVPQRRAEATEPTTPPSMPGEAS
jgi:hypothetical protein